jgi:type I restriction enzyme S subunit
MTPETFCEHFATFADAPSGVAKLRELTLQLAVQGKLVPQDENDEPASVLRSKILTTRKQLIERGEFTAFATDTEWPDGSLPYSLPNGWEWIRLGELGGFLGGGTPSKDRAEFWDGKIPWVSPKDMKRPYMDDAIDHVSQLGVENSSGKMIPKGSLLMVVRGMILAHSFPVAVAMRELTINQDMKALQLALPVLGEYLLRCCAACKSRMLECVERSSHGTCRLPTEAVANFPIPLPPLAEQRRIVGKVDQLLGLCDELAACQAARREARSALVGATLDRLVSARSAAEFPAHAHRLRDHFDRLFDTPATIPQLRQAILQLAVQGQLVPQDPNDESARELVQQIANFKTNVTGKPSKITLLESEAGCAPLPNGWVAARFGDIMVNRDGERIPVSREIREGRKGPYDYYGASGVIDCIDDFLFDKPLLLIGEDGANLINRSTPIAFIAQGRYWVNNHAHVLDGITLDFLRFIELHINAIDLKPFVTGTAQPKMNQAKMNSIPIALPPLSEQKRIVSKVTELLSLCDALEAKLTQAESASTQLLAAAVHHLLQENSPLSEQ